MKAIVKDIPQGTWGGCAKHNRFTFTKHMRELIGKTIDVTLESDGSYYGNGKYWDKTWLNFEIDGFLNKRDENGNWILSDDYKEFIKDGGQLTEEEWNDCIRNETPKRKIIKKKSPSPKKKIGTCKRKSYTCKKCGKCIYYDSHHKCKNIKMCIWGDSHIGDMESIKIMKKAERIMKKGKVYKIIKPLSGDCKEITKTKKRKISEDWEDWAMSIK